MSGSNVNALGDIDDALDEVEEEVSDQSAARARHRNRRTIADLRSELRELNREIDSLEELVATLEALKPKPSKPKALKVPPRRKKRTLKRTVSAPKSSRAERSCSLSTREKTIHTNF